ncbi:putative pyridoxamine 5 -phosphate oxidase protein [Rosellinia necatrix]|uniref:Putative pyridoxamine 5-phosphate oxidase protein n=1 Tax=Rosellinia necatrix TaxID=77044 RepID=A0A1W2TWJ4_ROSNE|nr:putative pyridoxamine 5 -phosphate oxidase protein [Rosellinia necatrix]
MKLSGSLPIVSLAITAAEAGTLSPPEHIFNNPPAASSAGRRIPTSYESAVMGRRILGLTPLGNIATVFPPENNSNNNNNDEDGDGGRFGAEENRPPGLAGMPHSLMEYVADCEDNGNPTFLAISIETTFKNIRDGSNLSLAQQWTPPYPPDKRIRSSPSPSSSPSLFSRLTGWLGLTTPPVENNGDGDDDDDDPVDLVPYSAANLPRFSLLGHLEKIEPASPSAAAALAECFVRAHPDARYWLPGNRIHEAAFARLVVRHVYWVGGFGDRAYIGWIPLDEWRRVSRDEWRGVALPGEKKGWDEWSVKSPAAAAAADL